MGLAGKREQAPRVFAYYWNCQCDCGTYRHASSGNLARGDIVSCGCFGRTWAVTGKRTHGLAKTPEYNVWGRMVQRCTNSNARDWGRYGGRGISVCAQWRESFEAFISDMGPRPTKEHTLDRINNDGNYEPSNCRWATRREQSVNKRTTRWITCRGLTLPLVEWSERMGISNTTISLRIDKYHWPVDKAIHTPPRPQNRRART